MNSPPLLHGTACFIWGKFGDEDINFIVWKNTHETHDIGYLWQGVRAKTEYAV